ncbi:MAG TPA: CdaR family protein [Verrucomicrobiae bacterium]|nr:CdaR family protein [Verrucomicrobiae bacterium]
MFLFLRDLIFHDFPLKLFSLVLAILVWVTVTFAIRKEGVVAPGVRYSLAERTFYTLPVAVLSSAEDVHRFKVSPSEVTVTVQGDPQAFENLQSKDIKVLVDLTGIKTANELRKKIEVSTPPGISRVRVDPEEVSVIAPKEEAAAAP